MATLTKAQKAALVAEEGAASLVGSQGQADAPIASETPAPAVDTPAPKEKKVDESHLIAVAKDGETIRVHPNALAEHERLGWMET